MFTSMKIARVGFQIRKNHFYKVRSAPTTAELQKNF